MPTTDDLDNLPSESGAETDGKATDSVGEWIKRFNNLNSRFDKERRRAERLQAQIENMEESQEATLADIRRKLREAEKGSGPLNERIAQLEKDLSARDAELTNFKISQTTGKLVQDKFPQLTTAFNQGLLRSRSEFADDAAYETYLGTVQSIMFPNGAPTNPQSQQQPQVPNPTPAAQTDGMLTPGGDLELDAPAPTLDPRQRYAGLIPSAPPRLANAGTKAGSRSPESIAKEMMQLSTSDPQYRAKYDALTREMDTVLG